MHPYVITDTETGNILATFQYGYDAKEALKPGQSLYENGVLISRLP